MTVTTPLGQVLHDGTWRRRLVGTPMGQTGIHQRSQSITLASPTFLPLA